MLMDHLKSIGSRQDLSPAMKVALIAIVRHIQLEMAGKATARFSMVCGLVPVNQEEMYANEVACTINKNMPGLSAQVEGDTVVVLRTDGVKETFLPQVTVVG